MLISKPPENKRIILKPQDPQKEELIRKLLQNRISEAELNALRECPVTAEDLSDIIQRIYDLNEKYILELSRLRGYFANLMISRTADVTNRSLKK